MFLDYHHHQSKKPVPQRNHLAHHTQSPHSQLFLPRILDNMNYYVERAIAGGFSPTRFTCHMLIYGSLKNNKKVKVHAITYDSVNVNIKNLDSETPENIELSAKNLEAICIKQFLDKTGFYPEWNLQERGQEYPEKIYQLMNSYREFRKNDNHSLTEYNNELISHFRRCKDYNLV